MVWWEGAGGALAVHTDRSAPMLLELGHVVGDVVDRLRAGRGVPAEHRRHRLAHAVGQRGAVGPGEVGRRGHRAQVILALRRLHGRARELAVRQFDPVMPEPRIHALDEIGAYLMTEPARPRVDEDGDLAAP